MIYKNLVIFGGANTLATLQSSPSWKLSNAKINIILVYSISLTLLKLQWKKSVNVNMRKNLKSSE